LTRVLVVEDSRTQAQEIQYILEDAGFGVETVADGLEALKAIRREAPDLIVTDLQMPTMDGLALVDAVRQDYPFIPVVLITAFGSEAIAARALRDGAAGYVPKRFLPMDLIPTLQGLLAVVDGEIDRKRVLGSLSRVESEFILENDTAMIPPLVRHLEEVLAATLIGDPTDLIRVGVAVREALINAIEHGNLELGTPAPDRDRSAYLREAERRRCEPPYRDRRVRVSAGISRSEAVFTIRDEGPGFPVSALPDLADPSGLGEGTGRGLLLIRTFMNEVTFNEAGNEIRLVTGPRHPRPAREP
jgi:CheY-like chemotaxis protein